MVPRLLSCPRCDVRGVPAGALSASGQHRARRTRQGAGKAGSPFRALRRRRGDIHADAQGGGAGQMLGQLTII